MLVLVTINNSYSRLFPNQSTSFFVAPEYSGYYCRYVVALHFLVLCDDAAGGGDCDFCSDGDFDDCANCHAVQNDESSGFLHDGRNYYC